MSKPIIYINGWPGIGKLTIAKEIVKLIEGSKLVDNHLLIDPAAAVLERSSPDYQKLRKAVRQSVFTTIANSPYAQDTTFIFTDSQSTSEIGTPVCREHEQMAKDRGCLFILVTLTCSIEENIKRLTSEERQKAARTKLVCTKIMQEIRETLILFCFDSKWQLNIDISGLTPIEVAKLIVKQYEEAVAESKGEKVEHKIGETEEFRKAKEAVLTTAEIQKPEVIKEKVQEVSLEESVKQLQQRNELLAKMLTDHLGEKAASLLEGVEKALPLSPVKAGGAKV